VETRTGITHGHEQLLVFTPLRFDGQLSYSFNVLHRFEAVQDQIHRDLLQLNTISDDLRKVGCQFRPNRDVVSYCLAAQESGGFSNDLVYVKNLPIRSSLFEL
jgi:hypothetical protein